MALDSLPVEHLFTLVAETGDRPPAVLPATPSGTRIVITAMRGRFDGPKLNGTIADVAGGDWVTRRADGTLKLDVRLVLTTDDGASIFMTYSGFAVPAADGTMTVRVAPQFETGDERYAWLNNVQAVAHGTTGATNVTYDVYRLL